MLNELSEEQLVVLIEPRIDAMYEILVQMRGG